MVKIAVFVEGQTELIFVREYLLKLHYHTNIEVRCFTLHKDNALNEAEYHFPNPDAYFNFQIIDVGNDVVVLSRLLKQEQAFWNAGFDKIVAVRDMYSRNYRDEVKNGIISQDANARFIEGAQQTINAKATRPDDIIFVFATMEIEAWMLGLKNWFSRYNSQLTEEQINYSLGVDLGRIDPEVTFFHPTLELDKIFKSIGEQYDKSKGTVNAILKYIDRDDFIVLATSNKCSSFNKFHESVYKNHLSPHAGQ